jgi:hypothetical protein
MKLECRHEVHTDLSNSGWTSELMHTYFMSANQNGVKD